MRVDADGDRDGDPIILLHGGGQTRHSWRNAAKALASIGLYVIRPDLRGHGESDWARNGEYALSDFAADIAAMSRQCSRLPVIVGASLGGLASLLAIGSSTVPLARALILVDVALNLSGDGVGRIRDFMGSYETGFASPEEAAQAVAKYLPHRSRRPDASNLMRNLRRGEDGLYRWHWDPAFFAAQEFSSTQPDSLLEATRKISVPTLLVRGSLSEVVSDESIRHLAAVLPSIEVVNVADATHMVVGDNNDAFNAVIVEFLKRIPSLSLGPLVGVEPQLLRKGMGCFATGVTVITTRDENDMPLGFTANSVASVSLDPPLLLFCLGKNSVTVDALRHRSGFVVNVLKEDQTAVSAAFARRALDKFEGIDWVESVEGLPVLKDCLANLECRIHDIFDGGDHHVFVGNVRRVNCDPQSSPLLFFGGKYAKLDASA